MTLPNESNGKVNIKVTSEFSKNLKRLKKRYRSVRRDIEPTIEKIRAGQFVGIEVSGADYVVFKVRLIDSDTQKGKSGGYRLLYQKQSQDSVLLLTVYSKSDTSNIEAQTIKKIIREHQLRDST